MRGTICKVKREEQKSNGPPQAKFFLGGCWECFLGGRGQIWLSRGLAILVVRWVWTPPRPPPRPPMVNIHHCFYEHGATVVKRKENNAAALQLRHKISLIVNYSIIRGQTDRKSISKCPPHLTHYAIAKKSDIFIVKSEIRCYKPPPITKMVQCAPQAKILVFN